MAMDRNSMIGSFLGSLGLWRSEKTPVSVSPSDTGVSKQRAAGAFEGADKLNESLALWQPRLSSADVAIEGERDTLEARTRDILRNDAYVQGGASLHKDNIVGSLFALNATPSSKIIFGTADEDWESEFQEEVEAKWELWAESPNCYIDASAKNTFTELVRLQVGVYLASGETLATVEWIKGREYSTAIQMIDLDRLCNNENLPKDSEVRMGVRLNRLGAPISYQIMVKHPDDIGPWWLKGNFTRTWKEIPVRKPWGRIQVIHLFEQMRPAQTRGVTELVTALKAMKITQKFRDVTLQNAVMQAMFAATITSELPSEQVYAQLGGGSVSPDKVREAITAFSEGYLSSINEFSGNSKNLQIDGARIPHLYPGTKLEIATAGKAGPLGEGFEQSLLRYIAASLGVSYEQLSRDYTQTNYSSARAAMNETWKFMSARKKLIADRFATHCFRLWLEEAILNDKLKTFPASQAGLLFTDGRLNQKFDAISQCQWIGASRGQIDEMKETEAALLRVDGGLSTYETEIARQGGDWRKTLRQRAREQKFIEKLGLRLNTNSKNSSSPDPLDAATQEPV